MTTQTTERELTPLQQECCAVWGEAGLAAMEAHCAAGSMTLEQYIEAIAHRPGGVCDEHGLNIDDMPAEKIANVMATARIVTDMQDAMDALLLQPKDFFNPPEA